MSAFPKPEKCPHINHARDCMTVFLKRAAHAIDAQFGEGQAKANPVVLAACITAQSVESQSTCLANAVHHLAHEICEHFGGEYEEEEEGIAS